MICSQKWVYQQMISGTRKHFKVLSLNNSALCNGYQKQFYIYRRKADTSSGTTISGTLSLTR